MRIFVSLAAVLSLSACTVSEPPPSRFLPAIGPMPAMKSFAISRGAPPRRSNASIASDFMELTFRMESGRQLPVFTRFEGPIRIGLRGPVPSTARIDLDRLVGRLRSEAGIDVARVEAGQPSNLNVEFVSRAAMQRTVPDAACFVVPRNQSFSEFRRARRSGGSEWAALVRRDAATVFIPADVSPQEVRDCLHEEIAQALGPLNDLYRLQDSIFNDDNFQTVLTGFDMLILRVTYAPELTSGMSEADVAARLPALLARLNPAGQRRGFPSAPENRAWSEAITTALGPLNDLYRLQDSIFNDDNFQTVLTGFDMLILRVTYAPELTSGMSEADVAARLPALLARLNPAGQRRGFPSAPENRAWSEAITTALGPRTPASQRQTAALRALAIAQESGWSDVRLAFSHFTLGRVALPRDSDLSVASHVHAATLYGQAGAQVQEAHVAMQLAAYALSSGRPEAAISLIDRHAPIAQRSENAALLATLLLIKAESLDALGRRDAAQAVRLDALGWARYGFGSEAEVRSRVAEIAALRPRIAVRSQ